MEDEIDIRHLIEVLLAGKWIIAGITAAAMLVSGLVSFFVLPPTYEATTTLLVNLPPKEQPPPGGQGVENVLSRLSPYPQMGIETLRQQVTSPAVLAQVISELKLGLTPADLAGRVKATVPKDTNLIEISVKDQDPQRAATIANVLVRHYLEFVSRVNQGQFERSSQFIQSQIAAEQQNLQKALDRLKAFLQQPPGVDELTEEVKAKVELLARYKARQTELTVLIRATEAEVRAAREQLRTLSPTVDTTRSILDDPTLQQLATDLGRTDVLRLSGLKITSQEVNPGWAAAAENLATKEASLAQLRGEQQALDRAIATTEKELEELRTRLAEKSTQQEQLETQVDVSKEAIKAFTQKYQETRISEAARIAETTLTVAGEAVPPEKPVGPRKMLNVALAGVLGAMVSVFTVLFLDFWRSGTGAASAGAGASAGRD